MLLKKPLILISLFFVGLCGFNNNIVFADQKQLKWINPVWQDISLSSSFSTFSTRNIQNVPKSSSSCTSYESFKSTLQQNFINRSTSFDVHLNYNFKFKDVENIILSARDAIMDQDGYIAGNIYSFQASWYGLNGNVDITFTVVYWTTYEQEQLVTTRVNEIVSQIITSSMNEEEKVNAIHDWVVLNVEYDQTFQNHSAYDALFEDKKAVCQGYTLLSIRLLQEVNIESKYISGEVHKDGTWEGHAWNLVHVCGNWYHMDTTWDDPIVSPPDPDFIRWQYYLKSDDTMGQDHYWETADYPAAPADFTSCDPVDDCRLFYPHIIDNDSWSSEIGIINQNVEKNLKGSLKAYSDNGEVLFESPIDIPASGRLEILVGEIFPQSQTIQYIILCGNHAEVKGYTKLYKYGKYRVAIPAFSREEINSSTIYVSHIASTLSEPKWTTTLSLLNTSNEIRVVNITFNTGEMKSFTLKPNYCSVFTIAELFGGESQPSISSAIITNASGCIGSELFCDEKNNILSGIALKDDLTDQMYFPHIAVKDGWGTGVVAYNTSADTIELTITPYNTFGNQLDSISETISGHQRYFGLVSNLGLSNETAWIDVKSNTKVLTGFELFTRKNQMAGYTGVAINRKEGIFPKLEKNGATGIALVNLEDGMADVNLIAYNNSGDQVASRTIHLEKYEKYVGLAEAMFFQDISTATYVKYFSDQDIVGFQLNVTHDGMMLDALPGL